MDNANVQSANHVIILTKLQTITCKDKTKFVHNV